MKTQATPELKAMPEPPSEAAVQCSALLGCVLRIEHGWLTIRNRSDWLLWSAKREEVDTHQGVLLADIAPEIAKNQASCQKDKDEMSDEDEAL